MTINFYLKYHTRFGDLLFISGNNSWLGDDDASKAIQLSWLNDDFWRLSIHLPDDFDDIIQYKYILREKDGFEIFDSEESRFIDFSISNENNMHFCFRYLESCRNHRERFFHQGI